MGVWEQAWTQHVSVVERTVDLDDGPVLCLTLEKLRGRDGLELEVKAGGVVTVRDGKNARWDAYWKPENALAAAGLDR